METKYIINCVDSTESIKSDLRNLKTNTWLIDYTKKLWKRFKYVIMIIETEVDSQII